VSTGFYVYYMNLTNLAGIGNITYVGGDFDWEWITGATTIKPTDFNVSYVGRGFYVYEWSNLTSITITSPLFATTALYM
jgi:hypothetical protein